MMLCRCKSAGFCRRPTATLLFIGNDAKVFVIHVELGNGAGDRHVPE